MRREGRKPRRGGVSPCEPPSRILGVGVLRCRRDSDQARECFRKFGHKAGQAERLEEPGNQRGWVWGEEGEPTGLGDGRLGSACG